MFRALACALCLLHACTGGEDPGSGAPDDEPEPTCGVDDAAFGDVGAELTDIETVARARWTSIPGESYHIEWADPEHIVGSTPESSDTAEENALLVGLLPFTTYTWQIVASVEGSPVCSEPRVLLTGSIPSELPELTIEVDDPLSVPAGWTLVPVFLEVGSYLTIVDEQGRYVWAMYSDPSIFRMEKARDDASLLMNYQPAGDDADGGIVRAGFDGVVQTRTGVPGIHTDFAELPDGRFAAIGWTRREFGGEVYLGDTVLIVEEEGTDAVELWNAFDAFYVDTSIEWAESTFGTDDRVLDWSHVNGISYDEVDNAVLLSVGGLHSLAQVDLVSGATNWVISNEMPGVPSEYDAVVADPHSIYRWDDDEILAFNRRRSLDQCAEASGISLDLGPANATTSWSYPSDECVDTYYLGMARPVLDGDLLVVFTTSGRIDLVAPDGSTIWKLRSALGAGFGFSGHVASLY